MSNSNTGNSGNYNSGDWNSGNRNSGSYNSGSYNSGSYNSGNNNSGSRNSGNNNSGTFNSGDWNSRDFNAGCYNSGFFNSDTPTVRCFNKETGIKQEDFPFPSTVGFKLTEYVNSKLITYDYKEAWAKFWNQLDDDRKQEFTSLPNFDSKIFEEITGIKVEPTINKTTVLNIINQIKSLEKNILELKTKLNSKKYEKFKLELL